MRHRSVAVAVPGSLEYPRPVMPAGLSEDQQDALLDKMMGALLTDCPGARSGTRTDVRVRVIGGGDWRLDDDVVEF